MIFIFTAVTAKDIQVTLHTYSITNVKYCIAPCTLTSIHDLFFTYVWEGRGEEGEVNQAEGEERQTAGETVIHYT